MTSTKSSILLLTALIFGLVGFVSENRASQCIDCHNSPKKLIQITREIAKTRPVKESKSKGLG